MICLGEGLAGCECEEKEKGEQKVQNKMKTKQLTQAAFIIQYPLM